MNTSELKRNITKIVRDLRVNDYDFGGCVTTSQSVLDDAITDNGVPLKRRRVVLTAHGCSVATCTMCPLPDESVSDDIQITDDDIKRQIDSSLVNCIGCDVLTVYHNGNFFADKELSDNVRAYIYEQVSKFNFKSLVVECLPQFVTRDKLMEAQAILGDKTLQVAIGLQSWDDIVREVAINSTCTKKKFLEACDLLREFEYSAQVFLMFKPPFLTVEESINDLVQGVEQLYKIGIDDPIICPMRVAKNTVVDVLYKREQYVPPTLWQLIDAIKRIHEIIPETQMRVAMSCLTGLDGIKSVRTSACKKCTPLIIDTLFKFNHTHDIESVRKLTCTCEQPIRDKVLTAPVLDRVVEFARQSS